MGDTMAISRGELLKELLPGLNELFGLEYKTQEEKRIAELIDQIIANEEQSVKRRKELEDAIQEQSR
jgi:hypothetical protein